MKYFSSFFTFFLIFFMGAAHASEDIAASLLDSQSDEAVTEDAWETTDQSVPEPVPRQFIATVTTSPLQITITIREDDDEAGFSADVLMTAVLAQQPDRWWLTIDDREGDMMLEISFDEQGEISTVSYVAPSGDVAAEATLIVAELDFHGPAQFPELPLGAFSDVLPLLVGDPPQ